MTMRNGTVVIHARILVTIVVSS